MSDLKELASSRSSGGNCRKGKGVLAADFALAFLDLFLFAIVVTVVARWSRRKVEESTPDVEQIL